MDKEVLIKENNNTINRLIEKIIKNRDCNCVIDKQNGEFEIDKIYKKIITMEVKKLLKIYQAEFPYLKYNELDEIAVDVIKSDEPDGRGYKEGIAITSGTPKVLESLVSKYRINGEGKVVSDEMADRDEKISCDLYNKGNGKPYLLNEKDSIENNEPFENYLAAI